jgi:hypothetical protein
MLGQDLTRHNKSISVEVLGLDREKVVEWRCYVGNLRSYFISLQEEEDSLCWLKNVVWQLYGEAWL